jgi:hypothetical protein
MLGDRVFIHDQQPIELTACSCLFVDPTVQVRGVHALVTMSSQVMSALSHDIRFLRGHDAGWRFYQNAVKLLFDASTSRTDIRYAPGQHEHTHEDPQLNTAVTTIVLLAGRRG